MLTLILPYAEAGLDESIFSFTLGVLRAEMASGLFYEIVNAGTAFSCGKFRPVWHRSRALRIVREGRRPKFLSNLKYLQYSSERDHFHDHSDLACILLGCF